MPLPPFFRPQANGRLELRWKPPTPAPGSVIQVCVKLYAGEPLAVRCGQLRLLLYETAYSRTVLDGYQEHARRRTAAAVELCGPLSLPPGPPLTLSAELAWPAAMPPPPAGERPLRREWRLEARVELRNRRPLVAEAQLTPAGNGPAVDGRGFLPV